MSEIKNLGLEDAMNVILNCSDSIYVADVEKDEYICIKGNSVFDKIFGDSGSYTEMYKILVMHVRDSAGEIKGGYLDFLKDVQKFNGKKLSRKIKIFNNESPIFAEVDIYPADSERTRYFIVLTMIGDSEYTEMLLEQESDSVINQNYLFSMYVDLDDDACSSVNVTEIGATSQYFSDLKYLSWRNTIVNMIHYEDRAIFLDYTDPEKVRRILSERRTESFSCQMKNLQGEYKWVRIMLTRFKSAHDKKFRFVYLVQDIDESVQRMFKSVDTFEALLYRDKLTGLYNRSKMEDELYKCIKEIRDSGNHLSIFMMDLDNFEEFNQKYGEEAGDKVIRAISDILKEYERKYGVIVGRWGGERYVGICKGLDEIRVYALSEDIRQHVSELKIDDYDIVTCSIGVIEIMDFEDVQTAYECAEKELNKAKQEGKNCVISRESLLDLSD